MPDRLAILAEAARLRDSFEALGAEVIETDILQPAETLLDLYGEDIRARAYVTSDPVRGEAMLRPDFTVPVVQAHVKAGRGPARYTYSGTVFRKQEQVSARASEYVQVGYESFGGENAALADAEVFVAFRDLLEPFNLTAATGDMGLLTAAVAGLKTTNRRRLALSRHLWRPHRFRELMDRFGGRSPVPATRAALLASPSPYNDAVEIGLRAKSEVIERVEALKADASEPPISSTELRVLEDLLSLRANCQNALVEMRNLASDMPSLSPAIDRFEARLDALAREGVDPSALDFEASYGRTSMEYYDGFVFGFYLIDRPDLPAIASGGRYDALLRALGGANAAQAVGGVIRPQTLLEVGRAP